MSSHHYEIHKFVIIITTLSGLYFPSVEKIWPKKYTRMGLVISFLSTTLISSYVVLSIKYLLFEESNIFSKICMGLFCATAALSSYLNWSFLYCRHDYVKIFEYWDRSFQKELYSKERMELINKNKKDAERLMKLFGSITLSLSIFYSIISFLDPEKKVNHPPVFEYRQQSPDFELIVAFETTVLLFGISIITTFDSVMLTLVSLEHAQLCHLKESLGKIVDSFFITEHGKLLIKEIGNRKKVSDIKSVYDCCITRQKNVLKCLGDVESKIQIWIAHHQQLLRFHDELQKIYSFPLSVKYVLFVLDLCLVGFLTIKEHGFTMRDNIIAVAFSITTSSFFLINTIILDSIRETGETIFEEAFSKSWHLYPKHIQSTFRIIIAKSHRPLNLYFLKIFPVSPVNFARIFSMSYSFFTYLIQVEIK